MWREAATKSRVEGFARPSLAELHVVYSHLGFKASGPLAAVPPPGLMETSLSRSSGIWQVVKVFGPRSMPG